jgi:hypothetical protein
MKKIFKFIIYRPIICLLIFIILVFIPPAIAEHPQSFKKLIIHGAAIDKIGDEFEVTVIGFIPRATQVFNENYKVISAKEESLYTALRKIGDLSGRVITLTQSNLIFVNNELCESGLIPTLDYLTREYSLGNNSIVINSGESSAKDVLIAANTLSLSTGLPIEDIADFNETKLAPIKVNLEKVFSETFSPSKCSLLNIITLKEEGDGLNITSDNSSSGANSSESNEGGGSGGQGSQSNIQNKKIVNDTSAVVLKAGRKIMNLSPEESKSLRWARHENNYGDLFIKNFTDKNFTNSDLAFTVLKNDVQFKAKFKGSKPICEIVINPKLFLVEVNQTKLDRGIYVSTETKATPEMDRAIKFEIGQSLASILSKLRDNNVDLLSIYELFDSNKTTQFRNYLKSLDNEDDYLAGIDIEITVNPSY